MKERRILMSLRVWRLAVNKINRPSLCASGDPFPFRTYSLFNKASPNAPRIVIVVLIIVIGEEKLALHGECIIAHSYLSNADSATFGGL
jgi:hypothetical protein